MAMVQKPTPWTRHMDIKYHTLVKWVKRDLLRLKRINTTLNLADHFTKQLGTVLFHCHLDYILGNVPPAYSSASGSFDKPLPAARTPPVTPPPPIGSLPLFRPIVAAAARLRASWSYIINSTYI